jgi:Tfp pilus assembly protein PilF
MKVDRIMALALALPHKHAIQDQTEALIEAGYAALQADDIKLAEALFRQAVQTNVRSAEAWRALAETQYGARYAICLRWAEEAQAAARRVISAPYAPAPASRQRG